MAGFGKVATSRLWLRAWLVLPDAAKLDQAFFAHDAELRGASLGSVCGCGADLVRRATILSCTWAGKRAPAGARID